MTAKRKCSGKAWSDIGHDRIYRCSRNATVNRDGKWYCWQHDPARVKADAEKRRVSREIKQNVSVALWERRARNAKLAALVTPELAALLERLAGITPAWGDGATHRADLDEARALAARIRETLETNSEERE